MVLRILRACPAATWELVTGTRARTEQRANTAGEHTVEFKTDKDLPAHRDGKGERTLKP